MYGPISRQTTTGMLLSIALLLGCNGTRNADTDSRPRVVATVGMVADIVNQIGGPDVRIEQLIGSGVDPHLYQATRDDVRKISSADLVFYSGLMLEGKLADTLERLSKARPVIAITVGIDSTTLLQPDDASGHFDPHVWMDVSLWTECTKTVELELANLIPDRADEFSARAADFRRQLLQLHEYGKQAIQSIPADSRVLITSHDAFSYFGRAYGLEVHAIQGISTESEAGLQKINQLVDLIVQKRIQAVFVESSVPKKSIEALIEGARARGQSIAVGGELFSDAMGQPNTYRGTYVGMMDHNLTVVTVALGGEVSASGFQGKL